MYLLSKQTKMKKEKMEKKEKMKKMEKMDGLEEQCEKGAVSSSGLKRGGGRRTWPNSTRAVAASCVCMHLAK